VDATAGTLQHESELAWHVTVGAPTGRFELPPLPPESDRVSISTAPMCLDPNEYGRFVSHRDGMNWHVFKELLPWPSSAHPVRAHSESSAVLIVSCPVVHPGSV
jgi:hypothetical protein